MARRDAESRRYVETMRQRMRPPVYTSVMPVAPAPMFAPTGLLGGPMDPYEAMRAGLLGPGGPPTGLLDALPNGGLPNANLQLRPTVRGPSGSPPAGGGGGGNVIERVLGRLFGGASDPTLSGGQNAEVARQSRLAAALAILQAAGPSEVPVSIPQILGAGLAAGQTAAGEARASMAQANTAARREQALRGILGQSDDPATALLGVIEESLASGDVEAAKVAATAYQSLAAQQGRQNPSLEKIDLGNEIVLIDPVTGKERGRYAKSEPAELERVDLGDRIVWYGPNGEEVRSQRKGAAPRAAGEGGIGSLPVTAQGAVVATESLRSAIDRYEELATAYMSRGRFDRAKGQLGVPNEERDSDIADLEVAQTAVRMELKSLLGLGVLNANDLPQLDRMIGDPASAQGVLRDPEYILSRIPELRRFLDQKIADFERIYGVRVNGASGSHARMGTHRYDDVLSEFER